MPEKLPLFYPERLLMRPNEEGLYPILPTFGPKQGFNFFPT